ncbi:MAG: ATP-binding protein [Armatimonadota bacterium]
MTKHTWSLRWLIGGIYFIIMVAILGTLALYFLYWIERQFTDTMVRTIQGQARLAADLLAPVVWEDKTARFPTERTSLGLPSATPAKGHISTNKDQTRTPSPLDKALKKIYLSLNSPSMNTPSLQLARVIVLTSDGDFLVDNPPSMTHPRRVRLEVVDAMGSDSGIGQDLRYDPEYNEQYLFVAARMQVEVRTGNTSHPPFYRKHTVGYLVLAARMHDVQSALGTIKTAIGLAFFGLLLVLFFINASISSFVTKPLAVLSDAAERFADGKLDEHVEASGAAEIASLGASFNQMAEQLRNTITRLAKERAQAEGILASMVDGVIVTDLDGIILLVNDSAHQICGLHATPVSGMSLSEAIPHPELLDLLKKTIATGLPLKHEITFAGATPHFTEAHLAPVTLEDNQVGVVIVLYDVSHQRKVEHDRRDFVANVSHELRTPVTSIRAMAESLLEAGYDDPEVAADFLRTIVSESERLTGLLENLLKLSHVESDRRLITPEEVDLSELIRHVAERVIAPITDKHQCLLLEIPDHLPVTVDRDAIMQIILNLVDNARKYSPDGGTIRVKADCDEVLCIRVMDTGFGIPTEDLGRIFERFYRTEQARTQVQGGTGLGLAIVKHLVELHEGRIFAESEVGRGSCFTVVIPQPGQDKSTPEDVGVMSSGCETPASQHDVITG